MTGVWVHAVAGAAGASPVHGVNDAAVRWVDAGGLFAVVSPVDVEDYEPDRLEERLSDLDWLERIAHEHHRVVTAAAAAGPVVPAALATVYHDEARLVDDLTRHRDELTVALERVAGRTEWGVKAYARFDAPVDAPAGGGPGTAYLHRRRTELATREQRYEQATEAADAVHEELSAHAVLARQHPPQHPQLSGAQDVTVLNGAYLVDDDRTAEFERAVEALGARETTLRLELTGPWPPYSFAAAPALGAGVAS
ncbi:GvpL/GvpF family gas vesicle protein [Dactylosporangium roseum]|uniref:GvpL/GvpF family gas vesicle protein n=1 Tax=Dactylosporangium roseum TaxID=47989 RepID=A0ABY5YX85_9ACTN|nr:GvpL/GvpF family gas vesicle protein [Dactylosporangium roseum]UWZ33991.1 GvpL/GvpF family gas vesicle protein [Dactylosporangium roseum]